MRAQSPLTETRPLFPASYHRWQWLVIRLMNLAAGYDKWTLLNVTGGQSTLIPVHTVRRPSTMIIYGAVLGVLERRREAFCDPILTLNNWPSFGMSWQSKKVFIPHSSVFSDSRSHPRLGVCCVPGTVLGVRQMHTSTTKADAVTVHSGVPGVTHFSWAGAQGGGLPTALTSKNIPESERACNSATFIRQTGAECPWLTRLWGYWVDKTESLLWTYIFMKETENR